MNTALSGKATRPLGHSEVSWAIGAQLQKMPLRKDGNPYEQLVEHKILSPDTARSYVQSVGQGPNGNEFLDLLSEVLEMATDKPDAFQQCEQARTIFMALRHPDFPV